MDKQTSARARSSPCATDLHDSPVNENREKHLIDETDNFFTSKSSPGAEGNDTENAELRANESVTLDLCRSRSIPVPVEGRPRTSSNFSLLNDAVVKYEKKCDDMYDSTIAMCNIFSTTPDKKNNEDMSEEVHSTKDNGEILITDLDSLSCDMKIDSEKESQLETSNHSDNNIDLSNNNNDMAPHIILLDLQSQDEYVSHFLNGGMDDTEKIKVKESELFSAEQMQTSHDSFCFETESTREMCENNTFFQNQNEVINSPEFAHDRRFDLDHQNSPIFFHDLNYDYDQMHSKHFHKTEDKETECDSVFYASEGFSQYKDETTWHDKVSYVSPKMPVNSNTNADYHSQYYGFTVNDSGFIDASHISSEKNELCNGRTLDFSVKATNRIFGTTRCNLNEKYFDALCSTPCESSLSCNSKLKNHLVNPYENPMFTESVSPKAPICFVNHPTLSVTNPLLYKSTVRDSGASYKHGVTSYSDLSETWSVSGYPEWNTWNNESNQELSLIAVPPPPFVSAQFPQTKYIWHGDGNKSESTEMYHEYLKPVVNENDSEETDDADEFDDVPLFFNTSNIFSGHERHGPSLRSLCHNEGISGSQFSSESLTPPPSVSNTPSDASSLYSSPPLTSNNCKPPGVTLENNLTPYEIGPTPKRPYPSMADMMRSSRSSTAKASAMTQKGTVVNAVSNGGRFRKNQIQSDTISTSTAKSTRYKKKWTTNAKKSESDNVDDMFINLDRLEEAEQNHGTRRHNEPLRQHAIDIMSQWYEDHLDNPYPTKADKIKMATEGGVTVTQVKSWFANKRNRSNNTKPKVQKRVMEEKLKELFKDITCNRSIPLAENSHIIQQLSGIIQTCHSNKTE